MMKTTAIAAIAFLAIVAAASFRQAVPSVESSPRFEIFVGTSPCADFIKPKLQIPAGEKCDRITWQLTIFDSGKYALTQEWGFHVDNSTYLKQGKTGRSGVWEIQKAEPPIRAERWYNSTRINLTLSHSRHLIFTSFIFSIRTKTWLWETRVPATH